MANELRTRQNFLGGKIEDNPLLVGATTLTSAALAAMVAIGTTAYMSIVLDPDGLYGEPEIVWITAHSAGATTATILRGQEGSTARQHKQDVDWSHGATAADDTPTFIGARAYVSADQSIPNAAFTSLPMAAESFDTHAIHDTVTNNSRLTLPIAGKWRIDASIGWYASNSGTMRYVRIYKNNATQLAECYFLPGTSITSTPATVVDQFAAGDYVELQGYQDSGGALSLYGLSYRTWMSATYLGV